MIIIFAATTVNVIIDCSNLAEYIVICSIKLNALRLTGLQKETVRQGTPKAVCPLSETE